MAKSDSNAKIWAFFINVIFKIYCSHDVGANILEKKYISLMNIVSNLEKFDANRFSNADTILNRCFNLLD